MGDHTIILNEKYYIGSGRIFKYAVNKYGKHNFIKEILEWFETREEAFKAQEKYIKQYNTLYPNGYNLSPKGGLRVKGCHSKETINKIKKSNTGKKRSAQQCINIGKCKKGRKLTLNQKEQISLTLQNHVVLQETRNKISKSHIGKTKPWLKKERSKETKDKISKTKKLNPFIYTDEIRSKMSNAKKGKVPWNKGLQIIH